MSKGCSWLWKGASRALVTLGREGQCVCARARVCVCVCLSFVTPLETNNIDLWVSPLRVRVCVCVEPGPLTLHRQESALAQTGPSKPHRPLPHATTSHSPPFFTGSPPRALEDAAELGFTMGGEGCIGAS
jgi:hypothetical protein